MEYKNAEKVTGIQRKNRMTVIAGYLITILKRTVSLSTTQNSIQFLKFTLFSISAGIVQTISFTLLNELMLFTYWPSYLIALILSVLYNFTINRRFTFKSVANIPMAMLKITGYYCVFTPLSTWWGDYLTNVGWNDYLVLAGTMLINFITEFLFCRFIVYRNSINTNELGRKDRERAAS
jgi:putative flippase GtrA